MNDNAGQDNLHALINNTRDLIWSVDTGYKLITSNTAFEEMVTRMTGKVISPGGDVFATGFTPEQQVLYKTFYDRAFEGQAFTITEHTDFAGGYWSELSFYPINNKDGEVTGTACFAHNITDFKRAQAELTLAHDRLLFHLENTKLGFIEWDDQLQVTAWSKKAEEIFGWSEQEFIGLQKSGLSQVYREDQPWVTKIAQQLVSGEIEKKSVRHRNYTKDGGVIWCEWFNSVLKDKQGKVITVMSQVQDITSEKEAADKMIRANHLYAFISQVNQAISHASDEQAVISGACRAAVEFGKFKEAWIDIVADRGMDSHECNGAQLQVLQSGNCYICNDMENDPLLANWKPLAAHRGWRSCIILPIKKQAVIGHFNIFSEEIDFFQPAEIALLKEAAGDISFSLNVFEKDKHRMLMEDKVIHSELSLKQAQSIAHVGSWELDLSSGTAEWSEEMCRIYGLSPGETRQSYESWLSFIHPDDLGYVLEVTKEEKQNISSSSFYHRITRKDGDIRHILSQSQAVLDKVSRPVGLTGVAHDITEMKTAENALAQSESNLRQIMDLIPQSIFVKDYNGRIVFANKSFAALYGLSSKQMIGSTLAEIMPVESEAEYLQSQDREVILSGETKTVPEFNFTDHKGARHLFHTLKVPFIVAGTNEKAVLGLSHDITEGKLAEAERSRMIADIVQRNKDLEQFSYIVSHNVRAPVANISGIAEILKMGELDKTDRDKWIDELVVSVKKLDAVIMDLNNILKITHTDNSKKEPVKFSGLLNDITFGFNGQVKSNNAKIISDFSAVDEILTLKSYLYSIFFNLVSNSIKYRQPGITPVIEIRSARIDNMVRLIFKDNGLGIDLEKRGTQVFGLYKRFHWHVEGKGMGLYMVKAQVESLGGKISVKSEVNKGTEFTIAFEEAT